MDFVKTPEFVKKTLSGLTWNIPEKSETIYLTFDDGPIPEVTPWVLDLLFKYNAKATFFCLGENVERYSELLKRIIEEGHSAGNHTYHHKKGFYTRVKDYVEDVELANHLIRSNLFRPPYGRIRPRQLLELKKKYRIIMWDVISCDYNQQISSEECFNNVIENTKEGSIIVFHDSLKAQKNLRYTLPKVLEYYKKQGFKFDKIDYLFS